MPWEVVTLRSAEVESFPAVHPTQRSDIRMNHKRLQVTKAVCFYDSAAFPEKRANSIIHRLSSLGSFQLKTV